MKRNRVLAATILLVAIAWAAFGAYEAQPTGASGIGPTIGLGNVTGNGAGPHRVEVNADTVATDPYKGYNIHIATTMSGGVTLTSISANDTNSTLALGGSTFCSTSVPTAGEKVLACTGLAGPSQYTTAAGLLGTFTFNATGNGCIDVRLVDLPDNDPNVSTLDTYTVNGSPTSRQANVVNVSLKQVLVGTGTIANCPSSNVPTPTPTTTPTPTNTATPTNTPTATATPISGVPDLTITLAGLPTSTNSGGSVFFTAVIKNAGSAAAHGVRMKVTLPLGAVLTPGSACLLYISGSFYCDIGTLDANNGLPGGGDETTRILSARMPYLTVNQNVSTVAMVSATDEPAGNQGNNTATALTAVSGCADLDGDGFVTILDFDLAAQSFGKHIGDPGYLPLADLDGDLTITVLDLQLMADHYLEACQGTDTDHDGLSDRDEVIYGTNPTNPDTDGDGIPDGIEVFTYGSNPRLVDTDGDGYTDPEEIALGKSPTTFCKTMKADLDKDHVVTILDLSTTALAYHLVTTDPGFPPQADFDHDGVITILDLSFQAEVYQHNIAECP